MIEKEESTPLTERIQEFDLADIAQFLRDDIQDAISKKILPERKYSVRISRSIIPVIRISSSPEGLNYFQIGARDNFLTDLARAYQRLTWNDAMSSLRPNFKIEIKYNGNADSSL